MKQNSAGFKLSVGMRMMLFFGIAGCILNVGFFALFVSTLPDFFLPKAIPSAYGAAAEPAGGPMPYQFLIRIQAAQKIMNQLKDSSDVEVFKKVGSQKRVQIFRQVGSEIISTAPIDADQIFATAHPFVMYPDYLVSISAVARAEGGARWVVEFPRHWTQRFLEDPRYTFVIFVYLGNMVLLIFIFWKWQLAPLKKLKVAADAIAASNFGFRIEKIQRSELGELSTAFNVMSAKVQSEIRSKEQLLMSVSHDLRTPITRIKLALALNEENRDGRIQKNLAHIEALVSELLELGRLQHGDFRQRLRPVALEGMFEELRDDFPEARIEIENGLVGADARIPGDRELLHRVLKNLVENALKYSGDNRVKLSASKVPAGIEIRVHDNGPGVPAEYLEKIFEPFFRVDESRRDGSFGLGLSLCRQAVLQHGGTIQATLPKGGGFDIVLTLPGLA